MRLEHLGIIGNCQFSALVDRRGAVVWCCLPAFDSPPVFGALLDQANGGSFTLTPAAGRDGTQVYLENTNILVTEFHADDGAFRVIDFAPRFERHQRAERPTELIRILEPIAGTPLVRMECRPTRGWARTPAQSHTHDHCVEFTGFDAPVRLQTDAPVHAINAQPFLLTANRHFVFSWGEALDGSVEAHATQARLATTQYWRRWVKECNIPPRYQREVLRSALVLKLHSFEDTGAIVAAMTTSIPESPKSGRTWDYRYCWLRDAYYVLRAFRRLGHFEERERFLEYLLSIVAARPHLELAPLYRLDGGTDLSERAIPSWAGYENEQPVRVGNDAYAQQQHDIYGEIVLALAPLFLDERFASERSPTLLTLLDRLARKAIALAGSPDAGIWELRTSPAPRTFSSLMSYAAADCMVKLSRRFLPDSVPFYVAQAQRIRTEILTEAWSESVGGLVSTYGGRNVDASLLQAVNLGLFEPRDPRAALTVDSIQRLLSHRGFLKRYANDDGFGQPNAAFLICNFWLVEALAVLGRRTEAQDVFEHTLQALSPLGLLSEDFDPATRRLWGNFPQAYSHVGLIHAAFAASPTWEEVL